MTTKEHIIKTSLMLFLKRSYRDVTMKDIVFHSGLSKGAVYHYFNSKEVLYKEIVQMFFDFGRVDYNSFNQKSLKKFYRQYLKYIESSFEKINSMIGIPESYSEMNFFLILFEAVSKFHEFLKQEEEMHIEEVKAWKKIIKTAKQSGEVKSPSGSNELAELFLYAADGAFIRSLNSTDGVNYIKSLKLTFDTIYENLTQ